jgi:hypothetical protein
MDDPGAPFEKLLPHWLFAFSEEHDFIVDINLKDEDCLGSTSLGRFMKQ